MSSSAINSNRNNKRTLTEPSFLGARAFPPLPRSFYLQKTEKVARQLLGKGLYVHHKLGIFLSQIVEVEAYLSHADPASHAHRGPTTRNRSMFAIGGTCYVYLSYGINYCMNVVTGPEGSGEAVLLRAAIPLLGVEKMKNLRGISPADTPKFKKNLMSGPGKLTQALGIDLHFDGMRFDQPTFKIVDLGVTLTRPQIGFSPRIGISKAKDEPLRFFIADCEYLSRSNQRKGI